MIFQSWKKEVKLLTKQKIVLELEYKDLLKDHKELKKKNDEKKIEDKKYWVPYTVLEAKNLGLEKQIETLKIELTELFH